MKFVGKNQELVRGFRDAGEFKEHVKEYNQTKIYAYMKLSKKKSIGLKVHKISIEPVRWISR